MTKPACYFHLGCHNLQNETMVDLHHPQFTIDENCMMLGVSFKLKLLFHCLMKERKFIICVMKKEIW
jgi:metal-dependent amidase/aminoacylase/carboxypeptidase family protein